MHKLRGLLYLTFRELWAKKIIVGLFAVSTLTWVALLLFMNVEEVEGGISMVRLFGSDPVASSEGGLPTGETDVPPAPMPDTLAGPSDTTATGMDTTATAGSDRAGSDSAAVDAEMAGRERARQQQSGGSGGMLASFQQLTVAVQMVVSQVAYWIVILLGLFSAAPLFARLLESGHVDLLLSKPMSRGQLFSGHILGVLLMIGLLATYLFGAVWLILSFKLGVWNAKFLLSILVLVGMFAVLYGVIAFLTVWTESTALALIVTYGFIFISLVLAARTWIYTSLSATGDVIFGVIYYVVPNFAEVGVVAARLLHGEPVQAWEAVGSTAAVGMLLLGAAGVIFSRRDF